MAILTLALPRYWWKQCPSATPNGNAETAGGAVKVSRIGRRVPSHQQRSVLCARKPAANRRSIIGLTMATTPRICHVSRLPVNDSVSASADATQFRRYFLTAVQVVTEKRQFQETPNYRLRLRSILSAGHGSVGTLVPRDVKCIS